MIIYFDFQEALEVHDWLKAERPRVTPISAARLQTTITKIMPYTQPCVLVSQGPKLPKNTCGRSEKIKLLQTTVATIITSMQAVATKAGR